MGRHNEAQIEAKEKAGIWSYKVRARILKVLTEKGPMCRRDIAAELGEFYMALSPRISELHEENKIRNSGKRKQFPIVDREGNPGTTSETIWELAPVDNLGQGLLF